MDQPDDNDQNDTTQSPEPESGIGKDVDSCDSMSPDGDLGKGDDTPELIKPKTIEKDDSVSCSSSDADLSVQGDGKTQFVPIDGVKSKPTSNPRFNNTVEPMEYEVHAPKIGKRPVGGWFGGRGPRKAVVIIVIIAVLAVALVVGFVLLADIPPPPESVRLFGYFKTTNKPYIAAKYNSSQDIYNLKDEFAYGMENVFYNTSFERAFNHTEVKDISDVNGFIALDFVLSLTYFYDNETIDGMPSNVTTPPVTTTEATTLDTATMDNMAMDDKTPLWIQVIINFVYDKTAEGKLTNFTGTMTLSMTDPASITTPSQSTSTILPTSP